MERLTPPDWRGQPVPRWRGVPCEFGRVNARLLSADTDEWETFPLLTLLPQSDPPGPLEVPMLGGEFFLHYGWQLRINYRRISFAEVGGTGRRVLDSSVSCGRLSVS